MAKRRATDIDAGHNTRGIRATCDLILRMKPELAEISRLPRHKRRELVAKSPTLKKLAEVRDMLAGLGVD